VSFPSGGNDNYRVYSMESEMAELSGRHSLLPSHSILGIGTGMVRVGPSDTAPVPIVPIPIRVRVHTVPVIYSLA
jgi:hypothetical protein